MGDFDPVKYNKEYRADKIKRIPLDVQTTLYIEIKAAADASGETVNGYIKGAIKQRMERDREAQAVSD